MAVVAYLRVSTEKQFLENRKPPIKYPLSLYL